MYSNGFHAGLNTHMTSFILIMRGEFDDTLQWPFTGRVSIDMYSNNLMKWIQIKVVDFKGNPVERRYESFTNGGRGDYLLFHKTKLQQSTWSWMEVIILFVFEYVVWTICSFNVYYYQEYMHEGE